VDCRNRKKRKNGKKSEKGIRNNCVRFLFACTVNRSINQSIDKITYVGKGVGRGVSNGMRTGAKLGSPIGAELTGGGLKTGGGVTGS
jgi:hypothetical protein